MKYNVDPVLITPDMLNTHACLICDCSYFTSKGTYGLAVPLDGSPSYTVHCNRCGKNYVYVDLKVKAKPSFRGYKSPNVMLTPDYLG